MRDDLIFMAMLKRAGIEYDHQMPRAKKGGGVQHVVTVWGGYPHFHTVVVFDSEGNLIDFGAYE